MGDRPVEHFCMEIKRQKDKGFIILGVSLLNAKQRKAGPRDFPSLTNRTSQNEKPVAMADIHV